MPRFLLSIRGRKSSLKVERLIPTIRIFDFDFTPSVTPNFLYNSNVSFVSQATSNCRSSRQFRSRGVRFSACSRNRNNGEKKQECPCISDSWIGVIHHSSFSKKLPSGQALGLHELYASRDKLTVLSPEESPPQKCAPCVRRMT